MARTVSSSAVRAEQAGLLVPLDLFHLAGHIESCVRPQAEQDFNGPGRTHDLIDIQAVCRRAPANKVRQVGLRFGLHAVALANQVRNRFRLQLLLGVRQPGALRDVQLFVWPKV